MHILLIVGMVFWFVISLFMIVNLMRKLERFEELIETQDAFIESQLELYETMLQKIRSLDTKQMFEKDDEVGSVFNQIKVIIENFKHYAEKEIN
jgi:hypothetical protein